MLLDKLKCRLRKFRNFSKPDIEAGGKALFI